MSKFWLPPVKQRDKVEEALRYHFDASTPEVTQKSVAWTQTHWYLQGLRRFGVRFPAAMSQGMPEKNTYGDKNQRRVRIELGLVQLQTEIGRLLSIDIGPFVERLPGIQLDGLRGNAIAQAALDNFWARLDKTGFKLSLCYQLAAYGTVGIGMFDEGTEAGLASAFSGPVLIPGWELRPLPYSITGTHEQGGFCWGRWVPYDWFKETFSDLHITKEMEGGMEIMESMPGTKVQSYGAPDGTATVGGGVGDYSSNPTLNPTTHSNTLGAGGKSSVKYVHLRQYWVSPDGTSVSRWIVSLGPKVIIDEDYATKTSKSYRNGKLPICPVHIARYMTVGSFWGRAWFERQMSLNRELEIITAEHLQSARERDRLTFLALPTQSGINVRNFKMFQRNRLLPYKPDYGQGNHRPEILSPPTSGDGNGKTINMISGLMSETSGQGPMYRGDVPGRLESMGGLQVLNDIQSIPMSPVSESIKSAMSGFYKAALGVLSVKAKNNPSAFVFGLSRVDSGVLGLTLNDDGTIDLSKNPLPDPAKLTITIRSENPRPKSTLLQLMLELYNSQILSKTEFIISAIKEGLDLPLVSRTYYEHYENAWMENIQLFGDGETPGKVISNDLVENHVIHMAVHGEVLASTAFKLCSDAVQRALLTHYEDHRAMAGSPPSPLTPPGVLDGEMNGMPDPLKNQLQMADMMQGVGPVPNASL